MFPSAPVSVADIYKANGEEYPGEAASTGSA
jgi:hypothetical protein